MDVVVKWYMQPPSARHVHVHHVHVERVHIRLHTPLGSLYFTIWPHSCSFVGWMVFSAITTQKHVPPTHTTSLRTFCKPFPSNSLWLPPLTPRMLPSRSCPKLVPSQLTVGGSNNLKRKGRGGRTTDITISYTALVFVVAASTGYLAINPNDDASRWKNHPKFAGAQVCGCVKGATGTRVLCRYKKGTIEVTRTNTRTQTLYPYKDLAALEGLRARVVAPYNSYIDHPSPLPYRPLLHTPSSHPHPTPALSRCNAVSRG